MLNQMLTDKKAKALYNNFSRIEDEDTRNNVRGALTRYRTHKQSLGEPMFSPGKGEMMRNTIDTESMFEDINAVGNNLEPENQKKWQTALSQSPDRQGDSAKMAITKLLSNDLKIDLNRASKNYEGLKPAYAAATWGEEFKDLSDVEFYQKVQTELMPKRKRDREFVKVSSDSAYKAVALGLNESMGYHGAVTELMEQDGYSGRTNDIYHQAYKASFKHATEQFGKHRESGQKIFDYLGAKEGVDGMSSDATEEEIMEIFDNIDVEDTEGLYYIVQALADARDQGSEKEGVTGGVQKSWESISRGFKGVVSNWGGFFEAGSFLPVSQGKRILVREEFDLKKFDSEEERIDAMINLSIPTQMSREGLSEEEAQKQLAMNPRTRLLTEDEVESMQAQAGKVLHRTEVANKLTALSETRVDPVKGDWILTDKILYPFLNNAAYTLQGLVPVAGFGMLYTSTANMRMQEMVGRGMSREDAYAGGLISAAFEAPIEMLTARLLIGDTPFIGGLLNRIKSAPLAALKTGAKRVAINAVINTAETNLQEAAQDAMPIVLQEIASAMEDEFPDVPKGTWGRWAEERRDVAWATLPMTVIGVANKTRFDLAIAAEYISNESNLELVGIPEKYRKAILAASSPKDKVRLYREAYAFRKEEIVESAKEAMITENDQFDADQADPEKPTIQRMVDGNTGREYYNVTSPDGHVIEAPDHNTAEQISKQFVSDNPSEPKKDTVIEDIEVESVDKLDATESPVQETVGEDGESRQMTNTKEEAQESKKHWSELAQEKKKVEVETGIDAPVGSKVTVADDDKGNNISTKVDRPVSQSNDQKPLISSTSKKPLSLKSRVMNDVRRRMGLSATNTPHKQSQEDVLNSVLLEYSDGQELFDKATGIADAVNDGRPVNHDLTEAEVILLIEISKVEDAILQHQKDAGNTMDEAQTKKADIAIAGLIERLDTLSLASRGLGTQAGRALSIRRSFFDSDTYKLANMLDVAKFNAQRELTNEERLEIAAWSREAQVARERIEQLEQEAEAANAEALLVAARETLTLASKRAKKAKQTSKAIFDKRKRIKDRIKELGVRVNDITGAIGLSLEMGYLVAELASTYVSEGSTTLDDVIDKVKGDIPDIKDQDVLNALGGRNPKALKKVRKEAEERIANMKQLASLQAEINSALKNTFTMKGKGSVKHATKQGKEIQKLKEKLIELKAGFLKTIKDDRQLSHVIKELAAVEDALDAGVRRIKKGVRSQVRESVKKAKDLLANARDLQAADARITDLEAIELELASEIAPFSKKRKISPELEAKRNKIKDIQRELSTRKALRDQINRMLTDLAQNGESNHFNGVAFFESDEIKTLKETLKVLKEGKKSDDQLDKLLDGIEDLKKNGLKPKFPKPEKGVDVQMAMEAFNDLQATLRTEESIVDLENQIRSKKYKIMPPKERFAAVSDDLMAARIKHRELTRIIAQNIRDKRQKTKTEKAIAVLLASRTLLATGDMSFLMRQGLILGSSRVVKFNGWGVPTKGAAIKAFDRAFVAFFSQNKADQIDIAMREDAAVQLERDRAGLFMGGLETSLSAREEDFMSSAFDFLPSWLNIIKASERNMVIGLNMLRTSAFDEFVKANPSATMEEKKAYAHYVNIASGRGQMKLAGAWAENVSAFFFAPRFATSRIELTGMLFSQSFKLGNDLATGKKDIVNRAIMRDFITTVSMGMSFMAIAKANGADVGLDPDDSDFGKIIMGDTHIDLWGGMIQPVRIAVNVLYSGAQTLGIADKRKSGGSSVKDLGNFVMYKTSPALQLPWTLATGKNVIGQDVEWHDAIVRGVTPLPVQEFAAVAANTGSAVKGVLAVGGAGSGIGVQEHTKRDETLFEEFQRIVKNL